MPGHGKCQHKGVGVDADAPEMEHAPEGDRQYDVRTMITPILEEQMGVHLRELK